MFHRSLFAAALISLLATAALPAGDKPLVPLLFQPDVESITAMAQANMPIEVHDDIIRVQMAGIHIQVRPMSQAERRAYFLVRSRLRFDPLPTLEQFPDGFTVFEVSFLNGSSEQFQFVPGMASILRGKAGSGDKELFPVRSGDLYSFFSKLFEGEDPMIKKALEMIYFETLYLDPGQMTSKLLIFEGLPKRTKRFVLRLDYMFLGAKTQDLTLPYLVQKVEP